MFHVDFSSSHLLSRYIPQYLLKEKKESIWEKALLDEYQRIALDPIPTEYDGKVRYLRKLI